MGHKLRRMRIALAILTVLSVISVLATFYYYSVSSDLRTKNLILESRYKSLLADFEELRYEYYSLNYSYYSKVEELSSLQASYFSLEENYSMLIRKYAELKNNYDSLASMYAVLNSNYESVSGEYSSFRKWYSSLKKQVNNRQGCGEDRMMFVTPDDPEVCSLVVKITGGWRNPSGWEEFWSDVKTMYDWVVNNINYSYDSPFPVLPDYGGVLKWREEVFRFSNETIRSKTGDCEDQAVLLSSMIRNYVQKKYKVWCVEIDLEKDRGLYGHVAVALPVEGGRLTIMDPSGNYYTKGVGMVLGSKEASVTLQDWFSHWQAQGYRNIRVINVFSDKVYREFSSNQEFIEYVKFLG
ncbi:MAG: transglutaminase-like domain-containing protein [Thermoproteota archaeon]